MQVASIEIKRIPIEKLNPAPYNPRVDLQPGDEEYEKLKRSLKAHEYVDPIIWNENTGNVVGGHQRLKILEELGFAEVDVSVVHLPLDEEKVLNVALNKIGGYFDNSKLGPLLEELRENNNIDELLTGFDSDEIDNILHAMDDDADLSDFFDESETKEKTLQMTTCPFCGKEHEV